LRNEKSKVGREDIDKKYLRAIILSEIELKTTERFGMMLDYILKFRK
jgi:hypothetical protein